MLLIGKIIIVLIGDGVAEVSKGEQGVNLHSFSAQRNVRMSRFHVHMLLTVKDVF